MDNCIPGNRGFTLFELMLASGVLTLALVSLFGSLVTISMAGGMNKDREVAVTHVASVLEELRSLSYDEILAYQPPAFNNLQPSELITVDCFKSDGAPVRLPVAAGTLATPLPNPLQVRCSITWADSRGRVLQQGATESLYR